MWPTFVLLVLSLSATVRKYEGESESKGDFEIGR
jgi:hypothetical protein